MPITSLKKREADETGNLVSHVPYWAFTDDCIIHVDGRTTAGLELRGIDVTCVSDERLERIHERIKAFLDGLPNGIELQFIYHIQEGDPELRKYKVSIDENYPGKTFREKISELEKDPTVRSTRLLLFITQTNGFGNFRKIPGLKGVFKWAASREAMVVQKENHEKRVTNLERVSSQISNALSQIGIRSRRSTGQELFDYTYRFLNPTRSQFLEPPKILREKTDERVRKETFSYFSEYTAREQLVYSGLYASPRFCYLDGKYFKVINLKLLPKSETVAAQILDLFSLRFSSTVSVIIHPLRSEDLLPTLKRRDNITTVLTSLGGFKRNYDAEAQRNDVQAVLEEVSSGAEGLFEFSLSVLMADDDLESLEEKVPEVLQAFQKMDGAQGSLEEFTYPKTFLSFLPGNGSTNSRRHVCLTSNLASFLPLYEHWRGSSEPACIVRGRKGEIISLDPFDRAVDAFNAIIVGSTGSGKSFSVIYLLNSLLSQDVDIVIVDVGGSYRRLVEIHNGTYVDLNLSEEFALNPFPEKKEVLNRGKFNDLKIGYLSTLVQTMIQDSGEVLGKIGQGLIDRAIREIYRKTEGTPIFSDLKRIFASAHEWLTDENDIQLLSEFAKKLSIWTEGRYGTLLNRPSTVDLSNRFVCFDLKGLVDFKDLQSVVTLVIAGLSWNRMMGSNRKTVIVFDEVWQQFSNPIAARLLDELYRTSRKYHGSVISASQAVDDYLSSFATQSILTNSPVRYILKVNEGLGKLKESFHLNSREEYLIKGLKKQRGEFSEIFLQFGPDHSIVRIMPTPIEYWICTTDPKDREVEETFKRKNPDLKGFALIQALAKEYPKGAL